MFAIMVNCVIIQRPQVCWETPWRQPAKVKSIRCIEYLDCVRETGGKAEGNASSTKQVKLRVVKLSFNERIVRRFMASLHFINWVNTLY